MSKPDADQIELAAEAVAADLEAERESLRFSPLIARLLDRLEGLDQAKRDLLRARKELRKLHPTRMGEAPHPAIVAIANAYLAVQAVSLDSFCEQEAERRIEESRIEASESAYEAQREDCLPVARSVARIPWPPCLTSGRIE